MHGSFIGKRRKENPDFSYAVDEHYYVSPQWLYDHVAMYDEYPRNVAVFAGEYAAHTEDRANSMESALAEAALLTGIEKNADVVKLASYAPLFNRIGHSQWKPDMIWFDDSDVYLTPNYYVQKLFANHRGTYTIPLQKQDVKLRKEGIYVSAAVDAQGEIILKLVNTNHREYALMLEDADGLAVRTTGQMWTLRGTGEMPGGQTGGVSGDRGNGGNRWMCVHTGTESGCDPLSVMITGLDDCGMK